MVKDLNDGLFSELDKQQPAIELYRRTLQRNYVILLLVSTGAIEDPSSQASSNIDDAAKDAGSLAVRRRGPSHDLAYLSSPLADTAREYTAARGRPSEFRSALRTGVGHLAVKIDQAMKKVRDPDTAAHLRDLQAELERALQPLAAKKKGREVPAF